MATRVNDRGQITIDRQVRRQLGVEPGMVAHQRVVNGHLEVVFLPVRNSDSLYGTLGDAFPDGAPVGREQIDEAVAEAVNRARNDGG